MTSGGIRKYSDVKFKVEAISPAQAEKYLEQNTGNRSISKAAVTRWANALRRGEWQVNGEAIKFDVDGSLVDGQHRLKAIVVAGIPMITCVIRGLPAGSFKTIDGGKPRTPGDCLYVLKYKNPHALAAAGRMLGIYETTGWQGKLNGRKVSNDQLLKIIDRHPKLPIHGNEYMTRPLFTKLIPHSVGMLCYYLARKVDADLAHDFFTRLANDDLPDDRSPARRLRETLTDRNQEYIKPSTAEKLAWVIQAWNAFYRGGRVERFSRVIENIPRLEPDPIKPKRIGDI